MPRCVLVLITMLVLTGCDTRIKYRIQCEGGLDFIGYNAYIGDAGETCWLDESNRYHQTSKKCDLDEV